MTIYSNLSLKKEQFAMFFLLNFGQVRLSIVSQSSRGLGNSNCRAIRTVKQVRLSVLYQRIQGQLHLDKILCIKSPSQGGNNLKKVLNKMKGGGERDKAPYKNQGNCNLTLCGQNFNHCSLNPHPPPTPYPIMCILW